MKSQIIRSFFLIFFLGGCKFQEKPVLDSSGLELEERIAVMKKIIEPLAEVPSRILDTEYLETRIGDGRMGPSDFLFHAIIEVPKEDIKEWFQDLKEPYNGVKDFSSPAGEEKWWLTKEKFMELKLYETKTYFGRYNGWMAIDDANGLIYVHTYTL